MRRIFATGLAVAALASAGCEPNKTTVTVMTRNLYLGGPIDLPLLATTPLEFATAVDLVWGSVQATDFSERAELIADEIEATRPDLIGLQEVSIWRQIDPNNGQILSEQDFLELLLGALEARGLSYSAVEAAPGVPGVTNVDLAAIPGASGNVYGFTDRDVILARSGLSLSGARAGNFVSKISLTPPGGADAIDVLRGWTSVDVEKDDVPFRFVNTHLEAFNELTQGLQAEELLGIVGSGRPIVLAGDINSAPTDTTWPAYGVLTRSAGFEDAWTGPEQASCCFEDDIAADDLDTLDDPSQVASRRIDVVLVYGDFERKSAALVGTTFDATATTWHSDHAGAVVTVEIEEM
jgi:endonuclease/exonuclease/phosphatase family metal-dependent hydrolase